MRTHVRLLLRRMLPGALVIALVAAGTGAALPESVAAFTPVAAAAQSDLLTLINEARADLNLRPLRRDVRLDDLAVKRAGFMTETGVLSHTTYGGAIGPAVSSTGLRWTATGEAVAMSAFAKPARIGSVLFDIWRGSPPHWKLITSTRFNYIGLGIAITDAGAPYGVLVFAETKDRTAPVAKMTAGRISGRTVTWTWTAADVVLQTQTSGVCNYDVAYRDDAGVWKLVRSKTTTRSLTMSNRVSRHVYSVRVRARDCAGNLSPWSAPKAVRVP